jgi:hypothetical protein
VQPAEVHRAKVHRTAPITPCPIVELLGKSCPPHVLRLFHLAPHGARIDCKKLIIGEWICKIQFRK